MRRLLARIVNAIADRLDPSRADQAGKLKRLEKQYSELLLKTHDEELHPRFDVSPLWGEDETLALAAFLRQPAGQALSLRFQTVAAKVAIDGCKDVMHTAHSAGYACGWSECYQWFLSLSRVSRVTDTKPEQALEDEEQLLERMSP